MKSSLSSCCRSDLEVSLISGKTITGLLSRIVNGLQVALTRSLFTMISHELFADMCVSCLLQASQAPVVERSSTGMISF
jgi:hypothetical protein